MAAETLPPVAREETLVVERVLAGDRNAYGLLVDRYGPPLIRYLARMMDNPDDAEDVAQEAFLRAYLSLASYDPCYRFSTWLYRIATNLAINRIKARRRIVSLDQAREARRNVEETPEPADCDDAGRPDLALERAELCETIQNCLDELPETYRAVVALRHLADLSYIEISDCIGLPLNTVRSRLHRGRERLGECLAARLPREECP